MKSPLLIHPIQGEEYMRITPERAGWEHLGFSARLLRQGSLWEGHTGPFEYGFVILGGTCDVESSAGYWLWVGRLINFFAGFRY